MLEEWLPLELFPDYAVSNYGYVKNLRNDKLLTRSPVQYGMLTVALMHDGQQFRRSIATLVAQTFLEEPPRDDFNTPIHLDGDRANCRADNLAWRPRWFAINYHLERRKSPYEGWDADFRLNETWEVFDTLSDPAIKYGLLERDIHKSIVEGKPTFPQGFTFMLLD